MYPLPNRHAMTAGELAHYFNQEHGIGVELQVVACEKLLRGMHWSDTGLPWVPPSPNMPTPETALVYPGGCLLEGTNLSEGRGTTRPFEIVGAPFLDPNRWAQDLDGEKLPGVKFRPLWFRPTFQKHATKDCGGVMVHVTDREDFLPLRTFTALLLHARRQSDAFRWRTEKYEFVDDVLAIDLLYGTDVVRKRMESGEGLDACLDGFGADLAGFLPKRAKHLLYP
jgi:uncharacterized protein YbbC (DUF1343 family)